MKSLTLKISNETKILKPLFKKSVNILIITVFSLIFFTITYSIINAIFIYNKFISNYLVLSFSAFYIIFLLGFTLIFFKNLIKKKYFVTRNSLLILLFININNARNISNLCCKSSFCITIISSIKSNDLVLLNNLAYKKSWHDLNEYNSTLNIYNQYINPVILIYESIIYLSIFVILLLMIFIYANKLYGATNFLYYYVKMKYFGININYDENKSTNNSFSTSKHLYVLHKYGIKYKENITKKETSNIISNYILYRQSNE